MLEHEGSIWAGFIQFGPEVLSVVYGAEEAAEETNALMNYFLFFPRSFFTSSHALPLTRGNFRNGLFCSPPLWAYLQPFNSQ